MELNAEPVERLGTRFSSRDRVPLLGWSDREDRLAPDIEPTCQLRDRLRIAVVLVEFVSLESERRNHVIPNDGLSRVMEDPEHAVVLDEVKEKYEPLGSEILALVNNHGVEALVRERGNALLECAGQRH